MGSNKIIKLKFSFSNSSGADIFGEIYLPWIEGKLYKSNKVIISNGILDSSHKELSGINGRSYRIKKNYIIEKYFEPLNHSSGMFKVIMEFILPIEKQIGMVKIASILNGFSSNRESKLQLEDNIPIWRGKNLGKLFQNLKSYVGPPYVAEVANISEMMEDKYFSRLLLFYNINIKSITNVEEYDDE